MLRLVRPQARSPLHHPPRQSLQPAQAGRAGGGSAWRGGASGAAALIPVGRGAWRNRAAAGGAGRRRRRPGQRSQLEGGRPEPEPAAAAAGRTSSGQFGCSGCPMLEGHRTEQTRRVFFLHPPWSSAIKKVNFGFPVFDKR